jgi:tyrosinase
MVRVRPSLHEVVANYDNGTDRTTLENLIIAFRVIQRLPADHPDSFFTIAGYHGEPFVKEDPSNSDWWGGYCQHYTVLFPTWHRAYVYRIEDALRNALRSVQPDSDLSLPFWDECLTYGSTDNPIPWILTAPKFKIKETDEDDVNPLYSYKLQKAIADNHSAGGSSLYSKPEGYETVRYPLSGLVGNPADRTVTEAHNKEYADPTLNATILNTNVKEWLDGTVQIPDDPTHARLAETYSAYARYKISLHAPNYTVFSNRASKSKWILDNHEGKWDVVALEEGHNAIHLALGGMYQPKTKDDDGYNADPIPLANGDMGENETAGFDPIFYIHHAFVDYVFWTWQKRHNSISRGSLNVIWSDPPYPGTVSLGNPVFPADERLSMTSELQPFKKPDGTFYTSEDVTDIEADLGYKYGPGSFDFTTDPILGADRDEAAPPVTIAHISGINRADYKGSFVIRTRAKLPDGTMVEIGRDAVLSRWHIEGCNNCMGNLEEHAFVPIDDGLLRRLGLEKKEDLDGKLDYWIQSRRKGVPPVGDVLLGDKQPHIELL